MARISFLHSNQVLEMLRKGIETDHFRARVSWPEGFDNAPRVKVSMLNCEFVGGGINSDDNYDANDEMYDTLKSELDDLHERVDSLIHEINIFAIDRDNVRHNMEPFGARYPSCYKKIYERKVAAGE